MQYVLAISTHPVENVDEIARILVESRLCACVNISSPMKSIYHWKDKIETDSESMLFMKTEKKHLVPLFELLREHHPYDVPEFVVLPIIEGSPDYLTWISESVKR